jgi:DNA-binding MarR family transcriptional regulator
MRAAAPPATATGESPALAVRARQPRERKQLRPSSRNDLPRLPIGGKYVNMADITAENSRHRRALISVSSNEESEVAAGPVPPALVSFMELFYFAYRNFTGDPDAILERYGFGRAHHRVLHFVHRNPGLKVAELLDILKITKQSLARVLKELREKGFIAQRPGPADLRERRLYLTPKGTRLTDKLTEMQVRRIAEALNQAGAGADEVTRRFLLAMIEPHERDQVSSLVKWPDRVQPEQPVKDAAT